MKSTILVVEDHQMNRDMITLRLKALGYDVVIAHDGREAVDAASTQEIDLVLMDMGLPVMNGWEATKAIRETGNRVPIIALTAHVEEFDRDSALQAGCDEFEVKPLDMPQLIAKMENLLAGSPRT